MKKLLLAISLCAALAACGGGNPAKETGSADISTAEGQRDSLINLIGEISTGISEVVRLENIVADSGFHDGGNRRRQDVINGISMIRKELSDRRTKLEELESLLKKSGAYSEELKSEIETQKRLIDSQTGRITALMQKIDYAGQQITRLESQADSLGKKARSLTEEKNAAERRSEEIGNELNACYYALGSRGELKKHGILEKKFLGKTKVLEADFERSFFTKADKRTLKEIATGSEKAKILTKQPVGSYTIVDGSDGNKIVRIDNTTLFWEKSDFLVIETE